MLLKNKQIVLMSKENHEDFHKNNTFDTKTSSWKPNNPNEQPTITHTMHLKKPKNKLVHCDFSKAVENKDETKDDKVIVKSKSKNDETYTSNNVSKYKTKDETYTSNNVSKYKTKDETKHNESKDDVDKDVKKHVKKRVRVRKNVNNIDDT